MATTSAEPITPLRVEVLQRFVSLGAHEDVIRLIRNTKEEDLHTLAECVLVDEEENWVSSDEERHGSQEDDQENTAKRSRSSR